MTISSLISIIWNVDSNFFTIPLVNHPVRWYGVLWMIGLVASYVVMSKIFKREKKTTDLLDQLTTYIIVGTVVGARLGHVLFYGFSYYMSHPLEIFAIWEGGLASHGGGIGIILAMYFFCRKTKTPFLWIADRIAIVVPLAGGFIRLGNLMNSEIIGKASDMPWAFVFVKIDMIPRHPAQLYEAVFCFILFIVLFQWWNKGTSKLQNGDIFATLFILLFTFRFIIEFFKANQEAFEDHLIINMGQILSIPFVLIGLCLLYYNKSKKKTSLY